MNKDGFPDLLSAKNGKVYVHYNRGNGTFE